MGGRGGKEVRRLGLCVCSRRAPATATPDTPDTPNTPNCTQVVYSYGFNQDASCVAVGTSKGYAIYNCAPFRLCTHEAVGGVALAEMLFCTSLLALVGAGDQAGLSPRCLRVWNTKRRASLYDLGFVSKIFAVKMNR